LHIQVPISLQSLELTQESNSNIMRKVPPGGGLISANNSVNRKLQSKTPAHYQNDIETADVTRRVAEITRQRVTTSFKKHSSIPSQVIIHTAIR